MPVFRMPLVFSVLLVIGTVGVNAQTPRLFPPRLNPLVERRMDIREWETSSSSPFGGSRLGGTDRRQFAFSPDGKLVATEDAGGWQLELWDVASGDSLGRFGRINDPVALVFSPDSSRLLTASLDYHSPCPVDVWDVRSKKRVSLDEDVNTTPFPAVAWSPDGKTLALGSGPSRRNRQPAIALWDAAEGEELTRFDVTPRDPNLPWFTPAYQCLTFSPDGRTLAGVREQRIHLWEVLTGKLRTVLAVLPPVYGAGEETGQRATGLSFSRDGRLLAVGCTDGLIRLWDVPNAAELPPLAGHQDALRAVMFVADGKTLLSLGADNRVLTWSAAALRRPWAALPERAGAKEAQALWESLNGKDREAMAHAVRLLAQLPGETLPLLRDRVKPVPRVDSARIAALVAELRKDDFNERKKAARALRQFGDLALPALRQEGNRGSDDIVRQLIERQQQSFPTREQIQALNGVQVLEALGREESRKYLEQLAAGADESLLTRAAKEALDRLKTATASSFEKGQPAELWTALGEEDAARAYRVMRTLARRPRDSALFLRDRLLPLMTHEANDDDPRRIAGLLADLEARSFATREKAAQALERLGKRIEPTLRKAHDATSDLDKRKQLTAILEKLADPKGSPERMQTERGLEVLELIGGAEGRQALEELENKATNAGIKASIRAALARLKSS